MKPSLSNIKVQGTTWDAKHLDNFLKSEWGSKFFPSYSPPDLQIPPPALPSDGTIRPSPSFISPTRNTSAPNTLIKEPTISSLMQWTGLSKPVKFKKTDVLKTVDRMEAIQKRRASLQETYQKRILPSERRKIMQTEVQLQKEYQQLKTARHAVTKTNRVLSTVYKNGILGVDSPEADFPESTYRQISKSTQNLHAKTTRNWQSRQQSLAKNIITNPQIEFSNQYKDDGQYQEKRSKRAVFDFPIHHHSTHYELFVPKGEKRNVDREQNLKSLVRGGKDYDIISGKYHRFQ